MPKASAGTLTTQVQIDAGYFTCSHFAAGHNRSNPQCSLLGDVTSHCSCHITLSDGIAARCQMMLHQTVLRQMVSSHTVLCQMMSHYIGQCQVMSHYVNNHNNSYNDYMIQQMLTVCGTSPVSHYIVHLNGCGRSTLSADVISNCSDDVTLQCSVPDNVIND